MSSDVVPIVRGTPDLADDELMPASVRDVSRFIDLLLKATKNIQLYRHAKDRYLQFLEPAHTALQIFLQTRADLRLKLGPTTLEFETHLVYMDETRESLTYKLYRDGVRILAFRSEVSLDELLAFTLLLIESDPGGAPSAEDMVTRLWKAELRDIEYIAVESFGADGSDDGTEEVELEQLVAYLQRKLASRDGDITRIARFSAEDLELDAEDAGADLSHRFVMPPQETQHLRALLVEEEGLLLPKMSLVVFNVLELDGCSDDFQLLDDALTQLLDSFLLAGAPREAVGLFRRLEELTRTISDQEKHHLAERLLESLRARMVERERLDTLLQYLSLSSAIDEEGARDYLSVCSADQIEMLVEYSSKIERRDRREVLVEALVEIGRNDPDPFIAHLEDKSLSRVRDMIAILRRIESADVSRIAAICLAHENLSIRIEGLRILAKSDAPEAQAILETAIADENVQIRVGAYRALVEKNPRRACDVLVKRMMSSRYSSLEQREKIVIARALGESKLVEALQLFNNLFQQKASLLRRTRQLELRRMAIVGLEAMGTQHAFHVLARELQNHENPREIQEACRAAALRLKEKLERSAA